MATFFNVGEFNKETHMRKFAPVQSSFISYLMTIFIILLESCFGRYRPKSCLADEPTIGGGLKKSMVPGAELIHDS